MSTSLTFERRSFHLSGLPGARWARNVLARALAPSGVELDGARPWDPKIRNPRALVRILVRGTLGAGESYVDGDWECEAIDELVCRLIRSEVDERWTWAPGLSLAELAAFFTNRQTRRLASRSVTAHYDRGNDLYQAMLGPTMAYSCAHWEGATTLEAAQDAKHDLLCRKLELKSGMRVLDLGCGWGAFAKFAAEHYGVQVVGVSLSPAQVDFARRHCAGLPVEIRLQDYRTVKERFDRVASIGMFEHVGVKNYRTYFQKVREVLAPGGLFALRTIGNLKSTRTIDPWIRRYIFPNAVLPSARQITAAFEGLLVLQDWHNFGPDYDPTLMAWNANFEAAWPALKGRYDERFRRMWRYYLLTCAGTFRAGRNQVWEIIFGLNPPRDFAR